MSQEKTYSAEEQNLRLMASAHRYHRWIYEQFEKFLQGPRLLEVGAGVGNLTQHLLEDGHQVTCTDINEKNLQELQTRCRGVRALVDDIVQTKLEEKFDSIICVNVLEHIVDDLGALRNMRKMLSDEGRLLLLVPAVPAVFGTVDEADGHYRRYTRRALSTKLESADFQVLQMRYMNLAGLVGWWWDGRVRKRRVHRTEALGLFDRLVPIFKNVERIVPPPVGLSLVVVAQPALAPSPTWERPEEAR